VVELPVNLFNELTRKLDELTHRYDLLLDSARDSIAYIHEGLHVYANRAYLELLKVNSLEDIEGTSLLELMTPEEGINLKQLLRDMNQDIFPTDSLPVTINTPGNNQLKADLIFSAARFNGEQCIQMAVHEQDMNRVLQEELERLRKTDQLTKLINRQTFTDRLSRAIEESRDSDNRSAMLYVEIDGMSELEHRFLCHGPGKHYYRMHPQN
jgi:hypothetical protein